MKKKILFTTMFFITFLLYSSESLSFLWKETLKNNTEIQTAHISYKQALLSYQTANGLFAPSVTVGNNVDFDKDFSWKKKFNTFSSYLYVGENLPGGLSVGIKGSYDYITSTLSEERFITQVPQITFSLSQSLYPFWLQGLFKNPERLSLEYQKNYFFYQYLYTKKNILQNVTQIWLMVQVYKKKAELYELSIRYKEKQKIALNELQKKGNSDFSKLIELEESILADIQSFSEVQISYEQYFDNLKNLCHLENENYIFEYLNTKPEDFYAILDCRLDPLEEAFLLKLQMQKNSVVLRKQNTAPVLSISVSPIWTMETGKVQEWQDCWNKEKKISWTISASIDFSSFFSSLSSQKEESENIEKQNIEIEYQNYLKQKRYIKDQYFRISKIFNGQSEKYKKNYEESLQTYSDNFFSFEKGHISVLELEGVKFQTERLRIAFEISMLYEWFYKFMYEIS